MDSQTGDGDVLQLSQLECGTDLMKQQFCFDPKYRNLNHGSFGSFPKQVRSALRYAQDQCEARPDSYIRYDYPKELDASRAAVADLVNAPVSTCVFVPNATTGVNTVLRNLAPTWKTGDTIIYFATIYGACEKTISYLTETTPASAHRIICTYPLSDASLCSAFESAIRTLKAAGRTPKLALFDTIVSLPGVRVPFEDLTTICRTHNILSLIDGAHGIGHIPLDLSALDPDFFISNCHKWLFAPRGCALLYVPERNQHLMRSTLPTSHGFVPAEAGAIANPLPPSGKSAFVTGFEFVGTVDNAPYVSVPAALAFRKRCTWQGKSGEEAIMAFTAAQAKEAGRLVSGILGTVVLENEEGSLGRCNFANVKLPLEIAKLAGGDMVKAVKVAQWIARVLVEEYDTFLAVLIHADAWWVRMSAQVYLSMEDWEWAGGVLKEICVRVENGEAL